MAEKESYQKKWDRLCQRQDKLYRDREAYRERNNQEHRDYQSIMQRAGRSNRLHYLEDEDG